MLSKMEAGVLTVMASIIATLLAATSSPPVTPSVPAMLEAGSSVRKFILSHWSTHWECRR